MAKLKFAFQAEYYKTHRRQLRDYVFGYFHIAADLAASIAPISNALMEISVIKNLVAKILGITTQRPFPRFTRATSRSRLKRDMQPSKKVVFLSDPFARYIEPETERAALKILNRCRFDVQILPILGAGASFLSKGFIEQARHHATRVLDLFNQVDPLREVPMVGIEPPEIYAFKHDYMDLLPQRENEIKERAENVWLLDEFLLRSEEFNDLRIANVLHLSDIDENLSAKKVMFHPHCHQRAEGPSADGLPGGTNATVELLRSCGYEIELMDTGCCGMAGTFGYEAEHYDLSMKVGELKLFPNVRQSEIENQESGAAIASSGAACRMQIRQGTGVEAVHPIMLIADLIDKAANYDKG
jgi:Fe-S oxidoreductase